VFDLSITKLLVLAVIALVIFGPNELPRIARQAGRALRDLRQIAEGAKADLREGLGPEFQDFDFEDLNPRRFVQKHLFEDPEPEEAGEGAAEAVTAPGDALQPATVAAAGEAGGASAVAQKAATGPGLAASPAPVDIEVDDRPPFDFEAT
jgi:sec-independent protein translocase protein TatB